MKRQTGSINFEMMTSFDTYVKDNLKIQYYYGVCETASDVVTKVINFPLDNNNSIQVLNGTVIVVHFINKNEVSNPKLNVQNGDSAKEIRDTIGNELTTVLYQWQDNDIITFKYDGTYWRIQNSGFIKQMASIKSNIQEWNQHSHLPIIDQGIGSIIDNTARTTGAKFTIEVPITTPPKHSAECCTGILCVKATGTGSDVYILKGFDFNIVDNRVVVQTHWETSGATTANNVTISVKASYLRIFSFAETVRSPWANDTQF